MFRYGGDSRRPVKLSDPRPVKRDVDADYTGNAGKDGYTRLAQGAPGYSSPPVGREDEVFPSPRPFIDS